MEYFENKVIVITGGSAGIGKAAVERFANHGAVVVIWDVNSIAGAQLAESLMDQGYQVYFHYCNTASSESVQTAMKYLLAEFGRIDVLINNAGITKDSTLKKMTDDDWQIVIDVNLTGVFNCAKAAAIQMLEQGSGRIINVSSVVGLYGNFGQTNYAATKAGVIGMTKTMSKELGKKGITVNAVAPGFIATEMVAKMPEKVIQMMEEKTPVGRLGKPKDIAGAFYFLAGPDASFINGAVLSVDGGVVI
jgi:3-oxoacyl-[acyl-carrier protein] reductase